MKTLTKDAFEWLTVINPKRLKKIEIFDHVNQMIILLLITLSGFVSTVLQ
jgi:hypothetical protein